MKVSDEGRKILRCLQFVKNRLDADNRAEYDDDTTIIPRSTSIVARRLPSAKPGRGAAARYVSGKMPVNALNNSRAEKVVSRPAVQGRVTGGTSGTSDMSKAQTEEEKIAAMFKAGAEQWDQQQQEMATYVPGTKTFIWHLQPVYYYMPNEARSVP